MKHISILIIILLLSGCMNHHNFEIKKNGSIVKTHNECEYARNGDLIHIDTGILAQNIFRSKLECYKTSVGVNERMRILEYKFDGSNYSVKPLNLATSHWVAGDGFIEGDRFTGKTFMFVNFYKSGLLYYISHGTGP